MRVCVCVCEFPAHATPPPSPLLPSPTDPPTNMLTSVPFVVHRINHTLSCSFDGFPRPTVTWRFNGTTLVTGRDNYVIRESDNVSHVDIVGTEVGNSGEYECQVSNLLGRDSKTVFLTVQGEQRVTGCTQGVVNRVGCCIHVRWAGGWGGVDWMVYVAVITNDISILFVCGFERQTMHCHTSA